MNPGTEQAERYARAKEIFLRVYALPQAEREAILQRDCSADSDLLVDVEELLRYHQQSGSLGPLSLPAGSTSLLASFPPATPQPATIGRYRIVRMLGQGGMGTVYLAVDPDGGGEVAIKVLTPGLESDALASRMQTEAAALRRLDHPGIARLLDAGTAAPSDGHPPIPYLVMEYVRGRPLRDFRKAERATERGRIQILTDLCEAVGHAHAHGIVHRDLKPANVLVDESGRPRVLDFGLARLLDLDVRSTTFMTRPGLIVGTLQTMSPEQARGDIRAVGPHTDVYALGVIGYELLTGRLPYEMPENPAEGIAVILAADPIPAGRLQPSLHGNIEAILERAMRKEPADRYPTAEAMARDLRIHLAGGRIAGAGLLGRIRRGARLRAHVLRTGAFTVAAAALLAAGVLAVRSQRSSRAAAVNEICASLGRIESRVYVAETREDFEEVRADLAAVSRNLHRLPETRLTRGIERFILWRMGEADFHLSEVQKDPYPLRGAMEHWRRADEAGFDPRAFAGMDSATYSIYGAFVRVGRHHPRGGIASVHVRRAFFQEPLTSLATALAMRREVVAIQAGREGLADYAPSYLTEQNRLEDFGIVRNDLGAALTAYGAATDSLEYIDEALAVFVHADTTRALNAYWDIRASIQRNIAMAWMERAERTLQTADLDSAAVRLRKAQSLGSGGVAKAGTSRSAADLARLDHLAARLARAHGERRRLLESAVTRYESSLALLEQSSDSVSIALRRRDLAEALGDLAAARGDPALLSRADETIRSAGRVLSLDVFPVQAALVLRVQGRLEGIRWELSGDAAHRIRALAYLAAAEDILPAAHLPSFGRLLGEERARLGAGNGG